MRRLLFLITTCMALFIVCTQVREGTLDGNPLDPISSNYHIPSLIIKDSTINAEVNKKVTFQVTASDTFKEIVLFKWSLDSGKTWVDSSKNGAFVTSWTPATSPGAHTVWVKAITSDGVSSPVGIIKVNLQFFPPTVLEMDDTTVFAHEKIILHCSGADSNGLVEKYVWYFQKTGNSDTTIKGVDTVAFASVGVDSVWVTSLDNDKLSSKPALIVVTVKQQLPTIVAQKSATTNINDSITITAQGTATPFSGTIKSYLWAKDGLSFIDSTSDGKFRTVWSDSGRKVVRVKIIDSEGVISAIDSCIVMVTLDAPIVTPHRDTSVLAVLPCDVAVTVSAVDTNKSGHIEEYYWDIDANGWDDSTTVPSFVVNVKTESSFKIRWAARDDDKQMADDTFNITVSRQPLGTPTIVVQKSARVKINDSLTITAQGMAAQGGGAIVKYFWAKDGVLFRDSTSKGEFRTVWSDSGSKVVRVKVIESDGGISAVDSCIVTVTLDAPFVTHHQDTAIIATLPCEVAFNVSATDTNSGGKIEKYYWDIGANGWDDSTTIPSYVVNVSTKGTLKLRWAARDNDGVMSLDTFNIIVSQLPVSAPVVLSQKSAKVNINDSLMIIAQAVASMGATIVKYFWAKDGVSFTDSTSEGEFRSAWSQSGIKVVRVKVVDSEGGISAPDSCNVTVTLDPPQVTHHNDTIVSSVKPLNFAITVHAVDINVSGHIEKYYWNTDGNGWKDSTAEPSYVIALTSSAPRKIRWAARDDDGIMVEDSFFINTNSPPSGLTLTASDLKSSWANFDYSTGSGLLPINFSATDSNGASDISEFNLLIGQSATSLIKKYQGKSNIYLADVSASTNVYFRFVVRDMVGDSSFITGSFITPAPPLAVPKITKSPHDTNLTTNTSATFTITADGEDLSYQWQKNSGSVWENIIGAYGTTYTTMPMTPDLSGTSFRCVVSNAAGNATSTLAIVTVLTPCTATGSLVKMTLVGTGQHKVTVETNSDPGINEGTIYRPTDLGGTEKYPIFVWGEGACAKDGLSNKASMAEIASHGYFVIADGTPGGSGNRNMDGETLGSVGRAYITWAIAQNRNPCSAYYQSLDTTKIAADGFSCGGQMALYVSGDPRFTAIGITSSGLFAPDATIYSSIHTPIKILLGGTDDVAYTNGMRDYEQIRALGKPVVLLSKKDAGHGGDLGNATGDFNTVNLAWLNWQLKGDLGATGKGLLLGASCKYCTDSNWDVKSANLP